MPPRPSNHEIIKKIQDALEGIKAHRCKIPLTKHWSDDLAALEISTEKEMWQILPILLSEIQEADPLTCYVGGSPPQRSYDEEMKDLELWPYRWRSAYLNKTMFLKFSLKKDSGGNWWYLHVDVHEDRPTRSDI